jgi:hypothetical protein
MKLTTKQLRYLKRLTPKHFVEPGRSAYKSEWFDGTFQSLLKAGYVEWLTPTLRARYVRITPAGRRALESRHAD